MMVHGKERNVRSRPQDAPEHSSGAHGPAPQDERPHVDDGDKHDLAHKENEVSAAVRLGNGA